MFARAAPGYIIWDTVGSERPTLPQIWHLLEKANVIVPCFAGDFNEELVKSMMARHFAPACPGLTPEGVHCTLLMRA